MLGLALGAISRGEPRPILPSSPGLRVRNQRRGYANESRCCTHPDHSLSGVTPVGRSPVGHESLGWNGPWSLTMKSGPLGGGGSSASHDDVRSVVSDHLRATLRCNERSACAIGTDMTSCNGPGRCGHLLGRLPWARPRPPPLLGSREAPGLAQPGPAMERERGPGQTDRLGCIRPGNHCATKPGAGSTATALPGRGADGVAEGVAGRAAGGGDHQRRVPRPTCTHGLTRQPRLFQRLCAVVRSGHRRRYLPNASRVVLAITSPVLTRGGLGATHTPAHRRHASTAEG
jgi:hypothetical protein